MRKLLVGCTVLFSIGCKKSANKANEPMPVAPNRANVAGAPLPSQLQPIVMGLPYQLGLKSNVFSFCDDTGPQQIDVSTGKQTPAAQHCDRKKDEDQSSCDDEIQIYGSPEGGNDRLAINDNEYILEGHSRGCDRDGKTVVVATVGAVEVIDGAANKVAIVDPGGGDRAAIGSGWVAWSTLDVKHPLRLETVVKALEHATTPKV